MTKIYAGILLILLACLIMKFFLENIKKGLGVIATQFKGQQRTEPSNIFKEILAGSNQIVSGVYFGTAFEIKVNAELSGRMYTRYLYIYFKSTSKINFLKMTKKGILNSLFKEGAFYAEGSKLKPKEVSIGNNKYFIGSDTFLEAEKLLKMEKAGRVIQVLFKRFSTLEVTKTEMFLSKRWSLADSQPDLINEALQNLFELSKILNK